MLSLQRDCFVRSFRGHVVNTKEAFSPGRSTGLKAAVHCSAQWSNIEACVCVFLLVTLFYLPCSFPQDWTRGLG